MTKEFNHQGLRDLMFEMIQRNNTTINHIEKICEFPINILHNFMRGQVKDLKSEYLLKLAAFFKISMERLMKAANIDEKIGMDSVFCDYHNLRKSCEDTASGLEQLDIHDLTEEQVLEIMLKVYQYNKEYLRNSEQADPRFIQWLIQNQLKSPTITEEDKKKMLKKK